MDRGCRKVYRAMPIGREVTVNDVYNRVKQHLGQGCSTSSVSNWLAFLVNSGRIVRVGVVMDMTIYRRDK